MEWLNDTRRQVAQAYADAGMNVSGAARILCVSTDTIYHHLAQIKARTGLDPRNFWDLARLLGLRRKEDRP